jgi:hypothetical protein
MAPISYFVVTSTTGLRKEMRFFGALSNDLSVRILDHKVDGLLVRESTEVVIKPLAPTFPPSQSVHRHYNTGISLSERVWRQLWGYCTIITTLEPLFTPNTQGQFNKAMFELGEDTFIIMENGKTCHPICLKKYETDTREGVMTTKQSQRLTLAEWRRIKLFASEINATLNTISYEYCVQ